MKKCYHCLIIKPPSEFYKNISKIDGLNPSCKDCHKAWRKDHFQRNKERVLKKNKEWNELHPEIVRAFVAKNARKKYKETKHTGIYEIYKKVSIAVKHGLLKPEPCRICKSFDVVAHHEDYKKPLDVLWYCKKHHCRLHEIVGSRKYTLK